jgi:hypothetical protein
MKVKKVNHCYCMNDCKHIKEGFVITYNDNETVIYLCEKCLETLMKTLNDVFADIWLESETS